MAKLSARGRWELVRMVKEVPHNGYMEPQVTVHTYTLMSDCCILRNLKATWPNGRKHNFGWKNLGKTKETPEQFEERLSKLGFKRTR